MRSASSVPVYLSVPLKSMCSMKCAAPASSPLSYREPERTQMPSEALRTPSAWSSTTVTPLGRTLFSYIKTPAFTYVSAPVPAR